MERICKVLRVLWLLLDEYLCGRNMAETIDDLLNLETKELKLYAICSSVVYEL